MLVHSSKEYIIETINKTNMFSNCQYWCVDTDWELFDILISKYISNTKIYRHYELIIRD